jgi:hypothetical protein
MHGNEGGGRFTAGDAEGRRGMANNKKCAAGEQEAAKIAKKRTTG